MSPDFEFFLRMKVGENVGHHWYGIFLFDFPLSILLCLLFHNLIRNGLIENLSPWFSSRFWSARNLNWNQYALDHKLGLIISIFIGILSHLLWDAFTHFDGEFVLLFPFLASDIPIGTFRLPIYLLLQILSSLVGLSYMYLYIRKFPAKNFIPTSRMDKWIYWTLFLSISLYILMVRLILWPQYQSFWDIFMAGMGSGMWGLLLTALIVKVNGLVKWQVESRSR